MESSANKKPAGRNERVWSVVLAIPEGQVLTYKNVAKLAGIAGPSGARQVGYAMAQIPAELDIPWHRVINSKGAVSPRANPDGSRYQRELLVEEGVEFDINGRVDLEKFMWIP